MQARPCAVIPKLGLPLRRRFGIVPGSYLPLHEITDIGLCCWERGAAVFSAIAPTWWQMPLGDGSLIPAFGAVLIVLFLRFTVLGVIGRHCELFRNGFTDKVKAGSALELMII